MRWGLLVLALALVVEAQVQAGAEEEVWEHVFVRGEAAGVASSAVLARPRHLLTVSPTRSALLSVYCVDLACQTTLLARDLAAAPEDGRPDAPHLVSHPAGGAPVIVFQRNQGS